MFGPDRQPFRPPLDHPGWLFASHLIGMLLLVGAVVAVLLLLRNWQRHTLTHPGLAAGQWHHQAPGVDPAVATVRARFAAGQIGAEEYAGLLVGLGAAPPVVAGPPVAPVAPVAPSAPSAG